MAFSNILRRNMIRSGAVLSVPDGHRLIGCDLVSAQEPQIAITKRLYKAPLVCL